MDSEFDVVVAGCGLAGLNAALTSARLGRRTLALGGMLGGQLLSINKIDGYPGFPDGIAGYDLCPIAQEQAAAAGAEFAAADVTSLAPQDGRWLVATADGQTYGARGVVIATGADLKELGVPGEERLRGKGVSHCASCDAPLLRGKIVGIVGGGDSAAQEALTLAEAVERVILFHRGDALRGAGRLPRQREPASEHRDPPQHHRGGGARRGARHRRPHLGGRRGPRRAVHLYWDGAEHGFPGRPARARRGRPDRDRPGDADRAPRRLRRRARCGPGGWDGP